MTEAPATTLRRELLSLLTCPETGDTLSGWDGTAPEGRLTTPAGRCYPVEDGIPNLLPDALRAIPDKPLLAAARTESDETESAQMRSEMAARDAQAADYDRMLGLRLFTAVEVPLTLYYLRPEPSHLMLEGGCGTGRMTAAFARRVRGLVCVDFSRESIRAARSKLPAALRARTLFVQADLSQLPLRSGSFDRVGSFGVYEHLPTEEARDRALGHLTRVLAARERGGRLALSAYRWGPPQSLLSEKEGHHPGGIYFVRLTMAELRARVERHLVVGGGTEALLYYHLLWGRKPVASTKG